MGLGRERRRRHPRDARRAPVQRGSRLGRTPDPSTHRRLVGRLRPRDRPRRRRASAAHRPRAGRRRSVDHARAAHPARAGAHDHRHRHGLRRPGAARQPAQRPRSSPPTSRRGPCTWRSLTAACPGSTWTSATAACSSPSRGERADLIVSNPPFVVVAGRAPAHLPRRRPAPRRRLRAPGPRGTSTHSPRAATSCCSPTGSTSRRRLARAGRRLAAADRRATHRRAARGARPGRVRRHVAARLR